MLFDQFRKRCLDAFFDIRERFTFGRTNGFRMILPLTIDFRLLLFDFLDALAVPQAVIQVLQPFERLGFHIAALREQARGLLATLTGGRINRSDFLANQFVDRLNHLLDAVIVERDIEGPFDATLVVKVGHARTNK